jgi:hypothetical protein
MMLESNHKGETMAKKKSWEEKLKDSKDMPKVIDLEGKDAQQWKCHKMVIVRPIDVYEQMASVPKGKLLSVPTLRKILASKYKVECACPMTTGIFVTIAANAAEEMGEDVPYHRTLRAGGELNPKFPNYPQGQIALLESEGFEIITKGRKHIKYVVKDFEKYEIDS